MADAGNRIARSTVNPFLINTKTGVAVDALIVLNNDASQACRRALMAGLRAERNRPKVAGVTVGKADGSGYACQIRDRRIPAKSQ